MSFHSFATQKYLCLFRKPALDHFESLDACVKQQEKILFSLLQHARNTQFGWGHHFSDIRSISDYQRQIPLRTYENFFEEYFLPASNAKSKELKTNFNSKQNSPYLDNIIWPGLIRFFSLSSGTTSGTTKFIPMTPELLKSNEKASIDIILFHFFQKHGSKILDGKTLFLGGNPKLRQDWGGKVQSGDLSGVIVRLLPFFLKPLHFPGEKIASIQNWEEKIDRIAEAALRKNISALGGVPTWVILFLEKLNEKRKAKGNIKSLWKNFELVVHGGIGFDPYRRQFEEWLGPEIQFLEVYPASEAFIAIEDPNKRALRLMVDYGTFYEFVPVEELFSKSPTRLLLSDIEIGKNYAIVLTTNGGLWSYILGDTIRFLSKEPPLIKITGRTKYYLSAFGEHVIQEEIENALNEACRICNVTCTDYHVAPVFPDAVRSKGRHQYVIEFVKMPADLKEFSIQFDKQLQQLNEDYAQHRAGGFGMDEPEFILAPNGFFKEWMKKKGKLGGQHKVPRISMDRELMSDMLTALPIGNSIFKK